MQKDPWHVPADQRASRCTGAALSVAANLLGVCVPGSGGRIMAFVGGPSTEGPGSVSQNPFNRTPPPPFFSFWFSYLVQWKFDIGPEALEMLYLFFVCVIYWVCSL
jgi:hypothetical protein